MTALFVRPNGSSSWLAPMARLAETYHKSYFFFKKITATNTMTKELVAFIKCETCGKLASSQCYDPVMITEKTFLKPSAD